MGVSLRPSDMVDDADDAGGVEDVVGLSRGRTQPVVDTDVLWSNILTYLLDKQSGFGNGRGNSMSNSALFAELTQVCGQDPTYVFAGLTWEVLDWLRTLSKYAHASILQRVADVLQGDVAEEVAGRRGGTRATDLLSNIAGAY